MYKSSPSYVSLLYQIYATFLRYKSSFSEKPPLSFCAKPKGEVAESNIKEDNPLLLGEGGPSQTVGEGVTTLHFKTPHRPCRAPSVRGD